LVSSKLILPFLPHAYAICLSVEDTLMQGKPKPLHAYENEN